MKASQINQRFTRAHSVSVSHTHTHVWILWLPIDQVALHRHETRTIATSERRNTYNFLHESFLRHLQTPSSQVCELRGLIQGDLVLTPRGGQRFFRNDFSPEL